jgi:hypothetical protein
MVSRMRELYRLHSSVILLSGLFAFLPTAATTQDNVAATAAQSKPFVIEYYYKVKWGYSDEFLTLFKKNHYPLLKKQVEMGRMLQVSMVAPRYHTTEDGRWDYRVTIVFKNAATANDAFDEKALIKQMYPDQASYKKEEQRRFEILDAHWDLPIKDVDLNAQ